MEIKKKITGAYQHAFTVQESGMAAIFVSARCKSKGQIKSNTDEDLRVEIQGIWFREIPPENNVQKYNIPPSFNGSKQKGLKKTVVFFVMLKKGKNTIDLIPRPSAFIEEIIVQEFKDQEHITLPINEQAEDGDRRPWFAFVLVHASLASFSLSADAQYRLGDSDDIKVIIDNAVQKQEQSYAHRFWTFAGNLLKKFKQEKEHQEKTFTPNLPKGRHYIEVWADRMPTLRSAEFAIDPGSTQEEQPKKRIPTVDDPVWTGDFNDDTEQMILARTIFGEARSLPNKGRIAVGWSVRNRMKDPRWDDTYHGVILEPKQYSAFNKTDNNRPFVENPFHDETQIDEWYECYVIAGQVVRGEVKDPTSGVTHYYSAFIDPPYWTKWDKAEFLMNSGNTLFYIIHPEKNGFIRIALLLPVALAVAVIGLYAAERMNHVKSVDIHGAVAGDRVVASKYFFINPETEELSVMHFDEEGDVVRMRQLTYDGYPKSHVDSLSVGELLGYFQMVHKRGEGYDHASDQAREEYYSDYIRLMIKEGEDGEPYEIYRGDVHTSHWELSDNKHVIIYYGCGTECLYAYVINIKTKEVESEYYVYQ